MTPKQLIPTSVFCLTALLTGCAHQTAPEADRAIGDTVKAGGLTYVVTDTNWYSQLGDGFKIRSPQQRFMEVSLSILNGGGSEVSVPLLSLQDSTGKTYVELDD